MTQQTFAAVGSHPAQVAQTPPAPPAPQVGGGPVIARVGPGGSLTIDDVQGLRVKLEALRDELQDAASRRRTVSEQLRSADSRALPGLEQRLTELDARIIAIEKEITATGQQLAAAPPSLLAQTTQPRTAEAMNIANEVADNIVPVVAILSIFVFMPFAIALSRFLWRKGATVARPAVDHGAQQRLDQLQQSVDAIAIEVERISEGQRFVTKLLNDRALASGQEPSMASGRSRDS